MPATPLRVPVRRPLVYGRGRAVPDRKAKARDARATARPGPVLGPLRARTHVLKWRIWGHGRCPWPPSRTDGAAAGAAAAPPPQTARLRSLLSRP